MPFAISDEHLPAALKAPPLTDDEFAALCAEHPGLMFETTADGELIVMTPNFTETGFKGNEISRQLGNWARLDGRGRAGDSSAGFVLANGARRAPDASWTSKSRIHQLNLEKRRAFYPLCPEFVIELQSESDQTGTLHRKMREYDTNAALLGWLIDPEKRAVTIYRASSEFETRAEINSITGEGIVAEFTRTSHWCGSSNKPYLYAVRNQRRTSTRHP